MLYIFHFISIHCYATVVSVLVLGIGIARGQYYWILDIGCLVWYCSNPTQYQLFPLTINYTQVTQLKIYKQQRQVHTWLSQRRDWVPTKNWTFSVSAMWAVNARAYQNKFRAWKLTSICADTVYKVGFRIKILQIKIVLASKVICLYKTAETLAHILNLSFKYGVVPWQRSLRRPHPQ